MKPAELVPFLESKADDEDFEIGRAYQHAADLVNDALALTWTPGPPGEFKVGMLIRSFSGAVYLVGDINPQGGACSCCAYFPNNGAESEQIEAWAMVPGLADLIEGLVSP